MLAQLQLGSWHLEASHEYPAASALLVGPSIPPSWAKDSNGRSAVNTVSSNMLARWSTREGSRTRLDNVGGQGNTRAEGFEKGEANKTYLREAMIAIPSFVNSFLACPPTSSRRPVSASWAAETTLSNLPATIDRNSR